jgi:hypothetical protein
MPNKILSFSTLLFIIISILCYSNDDDKIAAIFKETHEQVQEIINSEKIKENRKQYAIQSALDSGKSKLNDIKSFYVQRQVFKEAEKIKAVIAKFDATNFKAKTLEDKPIVEKAPEKENNPPEEFKPYNDSFYENNIIYLILDDKQKDLLEKKLIKPNAGGISSIETDNFKISGNVKPSCMVRLALNFEWSAKIYLELFHPTKKVPTNKMEVFIFNNLDSATNALAQMNISLNNKFDRSEYFDDKNGSMWFFNETYPSYMNRNVLRCLAKNYEEPFFEKHGSIAVFDNIAEHTPLAVIRKEILFSYLMSQNRNSKLVNIILNETDTLKKDLIDGKGSNDNYLLMQLSILFFINKNDHENLKSLVLKEGQTYFRVPGRGALINLLKVFLETELPLANDYCGRLVNGLKYKMNQYNGLKENEDKMIIVDAKYAALPMAKYFKGLHYFYADKHEESIKNLLELKDDINKYPYINSMLAVNYIKLGKVTEALKYKALALKEYPLDPVIKNYADKFK